MAPGRRITRGVLPGRRMSAGLLSSVPDGEVPVVRVVDEDDLLVIHGVSSVSRVK
jgi:hypothetical protein